MVLVTTTTKQNREFPLRPYYSVLTSDLIAPLVIVVLAYVSRISHWLLLPFFGTLLHCLYGPITYLNNILWPFLRLLSLYLHTHSSPFPLQSYQRNSTSCIPPFYTCIALPLCFVTSWICLGLSGPYPFLSVFCSLCMLHKVFTVHGSAIEVLIDQLWYFLLSLPVSHLFVCSFLFSPIVMGLWGATRGTTRGRILMGEGRFWCWSVTMLAGMHLISVVNFIC